MNHSNLLSLQDVQLVYRALPALHHVDWEVNRGQQWACLGPNGAGKTSLAKILSGEARRFSGVYTRSAELREQGVAYVFFAQARTLCER